MAPPVLAPLHAAVRELGGDHTVPPLGETRRMRQTGYVAEAPPTAIQRIAALEEYLAAASEAGLQDGKQDRRATFAG